MVSAMRSAPVMMAVLSLVMTGCGQPRESFGNIAFDFDPAVVPLTYSFFPDEESSSFRNVDMGGTLNGGTIQIHDGKGALILIGFVIGTAVVFYSVDVAYHQIDGVDYVMLLDFGQFRRRVPLVPGRNSISLTPLEVESLNRGKAFIAIKAVGKYAGLVLVDGKVRDGVLRVTDPRYHEAHGESHP